MILAFLLGGYLGGLLCLLLTLRQDKDVNVPAIGGAIIWPVSAAIEIVAIATPVITTVVGYVKAAVTVVTSLVNKLRGK
jgi:uncharacterized membrane protein